MEIIDGIHLLKVCTKEWKSGNIDGIHFSRGILKSGKWKTTIIEYHSIRSWN